MSGSIERQQDTPGIVLDVAGRPTIPKIIHQTWKTLTPPKKMQRYCASWKTYNPWIEYRFYDDAACLDFVRTEFPQYLACYEGFPFPVQRADFFRYLIVYRYGGMYADIDMECLQPLDRFFTSEDALFSIEMQLTDTRQRELGYPYPYQVANCIFAAPPFDPFLEHLIESIVKRAAKTPARLISEVEDATGPRILTRQFFERAPASVRLLNQIYWMPPGFYPKIYPLNKHMFACHHFFGSWKDSTKRSRKRAWIERGIMPTPFPDEPFRRFEPAAAAIV